MINKVYFKINCVGIKLYKAEQLVYGVKKILIPYELLFIIYNFFFLILVYII